MKPQPCKEEYIQKLHDITQLTHDEWEQRKNDITAHWFGDYDDATQEWTWFHFEKGKHITWQQWLILLSVEKAVHKHASRTISIASGRGIGKSATVSWIMLWFLFSYPDCRIPATAPNAQQLYDVLWSEVALWIQRMPSRIKDLYEWESSHVRIKESPKTWWARAKTASKENPEALSGIHADWVMALADEASAVDDAIFEAAQGIFSSPNPFMLLISNPTRRSGYFYRTHHTLKGQWQCFQFNAAESPVVDKEIVARYLEEGPDSDLYRINILGLFPQQESIDGKDYMPLLQDHSIRMERPEQLKFRDPVLGVDPAGEGDNLTAYCLRDNFFAQVLSTEEESSPKGIARATLQYAEKYRVAPKNIVVDSFGPGADVGKEIAMAAHMNVTTVNVAEKCEDDGDNDLFANKRAEMYWKLKLWIEKGGILVFDQKLKDELLSIRFRRTQAGGKIQIMPKREMRENGIKSPDRADALAMTMLRRPGTGELAQQQARVLQDQPFNKWGI